MSNTSLGMALKGSRLRMQQVANNKNLTEYFSHLLGETVKFLSPLASEDFREYRLNELENCKNKPYADIFSNVGWKLGNFEWNNNQPLWDGIALSNNEKTLYLIEAKSYPEEMISQGCMAKNADEKGNRKNIEGILRYVFEHHCCNDGQADWSVWMKDYYQLANRLIFLRMLKESNKFENVKLVLLNFVDDITWHWENKETTKEEWEKYYRSVFEVMTGSTRIPQDVEIVYMDIDRGMVDKQKYKISEINSIIQKAAQNIETFYADEIVNQGGITVNWRWCTEYVANMMFDMDIVGKLDRIKPITRVKSYNRQEVHDCKSRNNPSERRKEEKIAMHIRLNGYIDGIGEILDYQIPLKNEETDKAGKIDLLAYDKKRNLLRILELKTGESNESLLKAVLECETYKRIVDQEKLKKDFLVPDDAKIVACPLIFADRHSRPYRDYLDVISNERPYLATLLHEFKQQVIVIEEGLNRDIPINAPVDTRGFKVVNFLDFF